MQRRRWFGVKLHPRITCRREAGHAAPAPDWWESFPKARFSKKGGHTAPRMGRLKCFPENSGGSGPATRLQRWFG